MQFIHSIISEEIGHTQKTGLMPTKTTKQHNEECEFATIEKVLQSMSNMPVTVPCLKRCNNARKRH